MPARPFSVWPARTFAFFARVRFRLWGGRRAAQLLSNNHEKIARRKSGHGSSSSSDLAYAYGSYSARAGNQTENGYYLTIWQIDPDRNWKIIIDLQRKVPASEGKQD